MSSNDPSAARLRVGVIGTGRAGSVLGAALARAGHKVVAVHAVSDVSRLRAESLLPGAENVESDEVARRADLVLITIPDDALAETVRGLASLGAFRAGQFVMHASGRYGTDVLSPATDLGAVPLALHPAMTLTGTSLDLERLSGAPFGVTAPPALRPVAEALVVEMGGEPVWVPNEARALYHAALANGANHMITLVNQSIDLLVQAGVESPQRLLSPLLFASLDNALRSGDAALTGPVARGDAQTVQAHIDVIEDFSPEARRAYVALARLTADRALAHGMLSAQQAEALLQVLAQDFEAGWGG